MWKSAVIWMENKHKNYEFWKWCDIIDEMGKVNINEANATTTARKNSSDEPKRGKSSQRAHVNFAESFEVEKNVGVNMSAKEKSGAKKQGGGSAGKRPGQKGNGGAKPNRLNTMNGNRPKQLALPASTTESAAMKSKKNIVVHDELDAGMALMANRSAAAEYQKADITKIRQQRGKSMSGMVMDVSRNSQHTPDRATTINDANSSLAENKDDKKPENEKERFSKMGSTLIGVGVALVVAVVGFAAIAIFGNNKEKCVVDFESNGGSKVESTEIVCGRTVSQPSDPTKEGFEFEGWIFEGDPFDFSTGIFKNATLVAKWKVNDDTEVVKVSFDTDGGSAVAPVEVAKGKTMSAPNDPKKANWTFTGWYYDGKEFDFSTPIEKDMTLKANWKWSPATNTNTSRPSGNTNNSGANNNNNNSNSNGGGNIFGGDGNNNGGGTNIDDQNKPDTSKPENPPSGSGDNDNTGNTGGNTGDGNEGDNTGGDNTGGDDGNGDGNDGNGGGSEGEGGDNTGGDSGGETGGETGGDTSSQS